MCDPIVVRRGAKGKRTEIKSNKIEKLSSKSQKLSVSDALLDLLSQQTP